MQDRSIDRILTSRPMFASTHSLVFLNPPRGSLMSCLPNSVEYKIPLPPSVPALATRWTHIPSYSSKADFFVLSLLTSQKTNQSIVSATMSVTNLNKKNLPPEKQTLEEQHEGPSKSLKETIQTAVCKNPIHHPLLPLPTCPIPSHPIPSRPILTNNRNPSKPTSNR